MSVTVINNQPIRFQNEETIDTSCDCMGQGFCQLMNKNDATKFQLNSTDIVVNGEFASNQDPWTDSGWGYDISGQYMVYGTLVDEQPVTQEGILEIGKLYYLKFNSSGNANAEIRCTSFEGSQAGVGDGSDYEFIAIADSEDLTFIGKNTPSNALGIRLDNVEVRLIPFYSIRDLDGNIIFQQTDGTGVTASGDTIQYQIDWTEIEEGCYQVHFSVNGIDYVSDCITLKLDHDCSIQLTWTNDEDAFGFNYSDLSFTQSLRVEAKKWMPSYTKEKNVFKDASGNRTILKSETSKEELLTIAEMPQYLHDALAIGLEHDDFYIDGVKYTNEETEYTPKWRKSSQLAPAEVVVIKDQLLKNNSC